MRVFAFRTIPLIIGLLLACEGDKLAEPNKPPRIRATIPDGDTTLTPGDSLILDLTAYDPDLDNIEKTVQIGSEIYDLPYTFSSDTNGVFGLIYRASDGHESDEKGITLSVVNTRPTCDIISLADGDSLLIGDISITVEASDSDGIIESVEFYINDNLVFTDMDSPYEYTDTTFWHETGERSIRAVARDNDNAVTESEIAVNLILFMPVNPAPDTIYVPENYFTIQDAIYASGIGDVIMLADGNYEEHVIISHPLSLIGSGVNTVIDDHIMRVESDNVIIKNLKVGRYRGYESSSDGPPAIFIYNSAFVLIENVFARGGPYNVWFSPEFPDYPICTAGGPGIIIINSSNIMIQNSDLMGGIGGDYNCWMSFGGGPGSRIESSTNIFIVSTLLTGIDGGDGINAWDHSYIGIRNCTIIGNINNDATSTIIFP